MKNHVIILIQPYWSEWRQNSALRSARREFRQYIRQLENVRWAAGIGGINRSRMLDYQEIRFWLSDKYIELRGAYKIRITYAEFEPIVMGHNDIGDEWSRIGRSYRSQGRSFRHGWGYTQNPDHKPKNRPTIDPWYIETHHKRDKSNRRHHRNGARTFWVKQQSRDHRAWVKRQMVNENWDAFGRGADDSEYTINTYLWD